MILFRWILLLVYLNSLSQAQLPLGSSRLNTARHVRCVEHVETSASSCVCSNVAYDEHVIVLACTGVVICVFTYRTQILFVPSNEINVCSNKLVNNLHVITLCKLHNKLSGESCSACQAPRVEPCGSTSSTRPKCMGSTCRTCRGFS